MKLAGMNWADVVAAAARDPRAVLPIGSVEQHAQLSLCVDMILAEKVALDAAEPLGVPVWPAMPFGLAPYFVDYPGTVTLRVETLLAVMRDVLASIHRAGFHPVAEALRRRHGGGQRARRQRACRCTCAGTDGRQGRHLDQVPQLVARAPHLGLRTRKRWRQPCQLDRKLPLDPTTPCPGPGG